jgi:hypothetical protein
MSSGRSGREPPAPESPVWLPSIAQGRATGRLGSPGTGGFTLPRARAQPATLKSSAELFSMNTLPSLEHLEFGAQKKKVGWPKACHGPGRTVGGREPRRADRLRQGPMTQAAVPQTSAQQP